MLAVFGTPALEYLVFVAAESDGELKIVNVVAGLDLAYKERMNLRRYGSFATSFLMAQPPLLCEEGNGLGLKSRPRNHSLLYLLLTFESVYPRIRPE